MFGLARAEAVENWPRSSSKLIVDDLNRIKAGTYDFGEDEKRFSYLGSSNSESDGDEPPKARQRKSRS